MAWFPRPGEIGSLIDEPYNAGVNSSNGLNGFLADADAVFSMDRRNGPNDTVIMDDTTFFIAAFPGLTVPKSSTQYSVPMACDLNGTYIDGSSKSVAFGVTTESPLGVLGRNATVLQCRLLNSTYMTNFNFENGAQNVDINLIRSEDDEKIPLLNWINGPRHASSCQSQNNSMTVYGCLCVLNTYGSDGNPETVCDGFETPLLRQMAYQGVLQAFSMQITGH